MTVHCSGERVDCLLGLLRAEEPLEDEAAQQASLRHEAGVLEEARHEERAAIREYLAAHDTEPALREPLEALVRVLGRKREDKSLARLLETLVDTAPSPEESARALWELGAYRQDVQDDLAGARACLEHAVEVDPRDVGCWLGLELCAAAAGDAALRRKALEARAGLSTDPTVQGTLLVQLGEICAEAGERERAVELCQQAAAVTGRARFRALLALERVAGDARDAELRAHALEGQAELISSALGDPDLAEQSGVPAFLCRPEAAADAWLRAGELRRRAGDPQGASAALAAAAERLPRSGLAARLRLAAADAAGDQAGALRIAEEQLGKGLDGPAAAAMWLRIGLGAEQNRDLARAQEAYGKALALEPASVLAATLRLDGLARGGDPTALATALEDRADDQQSAALRVQAWLASAYVWAARAGNADRARKALERATQHGAPARWSLRVGRLLATLCGAHGWYEDATRALLLLEEEASERPGLWFELGYRRLSRDDPAGAAAAFASLAASVDHDHAGSAADWLGRALVAYGVAVGDAERDAEAVARFAAAEPEAALGRGLTVLAAVLGSRSGHRERALELLERARGRDPGDLVLAVLLVELRRATGNRAAAAEVLASCAAEIDDRRLAAALQIEAGLLLWQAGERLEAVASFESAVEYAPEAARMVLGWALRAADPADPELRRRAVELCREHEPDRPLGALERFGLGLAADPADAGAALAELEEIGPGGDVALAAALGRLLLADGADRDELLGALDRLEPHGGVAATLASAERFRLARFVDRDAATALAASRRWAETDPSVPAALEWLAAAFAADDRDAEVSARRWLASRLEGSVRAEIEASAALCSVVARPGSAPRLLEGESAVARLTNLELALPGSDPARRARALRGLGDELGAEARAQADRLAAWSDLARGAHAEARVAFKALCEQHPQDVGCWEGLRAAAEPIEQWTDVGVALAQLGNLCRDDARAAELWEQAGLVLLERTEAHDDAEIALERALERDPRREEAFDRLFRRVRARNEDDALLRLIDRRLQVTDDSADVTKMYWERARVLRRKGDQEGALQGLKDVTLLEPDHVAALALAGEINITRGEFAEAAPLLARLASLDDAPKQQRLMAGIAAVDLFEKRLGKPDEALAVLAGLHRAGLSTAKVRERLARAASRVGDWEAAVTVLEELMQERETPKGRAEAARLAMAIYRDKLGKPERSAAAVARLLEEVPDDVEGIELVLTGKLPAELRARSVNRALEVVRTQLGSDPVDPVRARLLVDVTSALGQPDLERAALGVLAALGQTEPAHLRAAAQIDARLAHQPQIVLDAETILLLGDPDDVGPLPELFAAIAQAVSEALGPSLKSEGVGRKQRLDAGHPLRIEISRWMGALGLDDFELFVGGRRERGVVGVAGELPGLVVGRAVSSPLDAAGRSAVAREVFALRRGTTAVMHCDDHTIASIVVAVSNAVGIMVPEPPYAVYKEVERAIQKVMSRKLRKTAAEACQRVLDARQDVHAWVEAARRSIDRMALVAAGDAAVVIEDLVGPPGSPAREALADHERARRVLSFALSQEHLMLQHKLGMGAI